MPRYDDDGNPSNEEYGEFIDDDYEVDDEDDDETDPCPHCGQPVHHEAILCPHCDRYLSREDAPPEKKPLWIVIAALLCLAVALGWALFPLW